jgi:hypothetical protein
LLHLTNNPLQKSEQGSVTPAEIADALDTDELPVEFESHWTVGTLTPED